MAECIFCQILRGTSAAQFVYQDDRVIGFRDIRPRAPVHLLLIPRRHIASLLELQKGDEDLVGHIFLVASSLARAQGIAESGFRVVVNCGRDAGQSVDHVHFHLLGGREFAWPPG